MNRTLSTLMLGGLASACLLASACGRRSTEEGSSPPAGGPVEYRYLTWYEDGSVDLITFEDREVIHVPAEQLGALFGKDRQPFRGRKININVNSNGPKGAISGPLVRLRPAWEELSGATLTVEEIPIAEQLNKTVTDISFGTGVYDGMIQGAWYMGELITMDAIVPIDDYIRDPRFPRWDPHWLPDSLRQLLIWDDQYYGVMNDSDGQVLYWRHDILTDPEWRRRYREETGGDMPFPPETWDDVIAIARYFDGKNWDPTDDKPDNGVVMHFRVNEQGMFHFMSLSAPYVVLPGEAVNRGIHNYWFDPDTLEPLINQPGHVRALETLRELSQYGPRAQAAWDLGTAWSWFLNGKALFVFSWGDVGSLVQDESRSRVKGKMGASALPGSREVYDMNQNQWLTLEEPNVVGNTTGGSWHGVILKQSESPEAVYSFYALMATRAVSTWAANRGWTGVDPGATIHFLPPEGTADPSGFTEAGWNEEDLAFYLEACHDNFYAETLLPYLRINGAEEYWRALDRNLSAVMTGATEPKEALDRTAQEWNAISDRRGRPSQLRQYQQSIGYTPGG